MEEIEYEERVLINKSDYKKVIDYINKEGRPITKTDIENIYLDNDDSFIYKTKKMLRIRTINNKERELTLKIKNPDGSNREINETLDSHPIIDKELDYRFNEYKEIARLTTKRIEVQYDDYLFVIDENQYHGITDYDLEVESDNQEKSVKIIKFYCEKFDLLYDPKYKSKSHRAITRAKSLSK